jgi:hypothetical protein
MIVMPTIPQGQDSENPDIAAVVRRVKIPISHSMTDRVYEKCYMPETDRPDGNDPNQERKRPWQPADPEADQKDSCGRRNIQQNESLLTKANKTITVQVAGNEDALGLAQFRMLEENPKEVAP